MSRAPWLKHLLRPVLGLYLVVACLWATGCQERIDNQPIPGANVPLHAIAYPVVQRDLKNIVRTGVLRMITHYNSSSYFIHKGGQAGFDYELMSRFADQHGLALEVIIPESDEDLVSLLNAGKGDVVCIGQTPEPGLDRYVTWTRPTNFMQKVVVLPADDQRDNTLEALSGLVLTIPDGDPFHTRLLEIRAQNQLQFFVRKAPAHVEAEELVARVSRGQLPGVVVDDITARAAMSYLPGLRLGLKLGQRQPAVWLTRSNSPELKAALNEYLKQNIHVTLSGRPRRSQSYGIIYDRYFENAKTIRGFRNAAHRPDKSGRISKYDDLIRNQAEAAGLDWRMVAALIYQESRFYPFARSKADARGLMQVLPRFAGAQSDSLYNTEANLRAGLRLMKGTYQTYAYLDSLDRWRFTLAEYHAGNGHVTDARRMSMDYGLNPNSWEKGLSLMLPRLIQRRYYSKTRHGFYGGVETVDYVEDIMDRYRTYTRLVPRWDLNAPPDSVLAQLPGNEVPDLSLLPDLMTTSPQPK